MKAQISLPVAFTERHRGVVEQYIRNTRLNSTEWKELLEAFDLLAQAQVQVKGETRSFATIYKAVIQQPNAVEFLSRLLQLADPENEGIPLKATYARTITEHLQESEWKLPS